MREQPVENIFVGALPIPQSQFEARLREVPKEKSVVIHCNTGILAKMAYDSLIAKGYDKVRWLNAVVLIGASGAYEVTENNRPLSWAGGCVPPGPGGGGGPALTPPRRPSS